MENHLHLIWQMQAGMKAADVQGDFLKYTAQQIKEDLQQKHPKVLALFSVDAKGRRYQFWDRNASSTCLPAARQVELSTKKVFQQNLDYIQSNPVNACICALPEDYRYSSTSFYEINQAEWDFLTHEKE